MFSADWRYLSPPPVRQSLLDVDEWRASGFLTFNSRLAFHLMTVSSFDVRDPNAIVDCREPPHWMIVGIEPVGDIEKKGGDLCIFVRWIGWHPNEEGVLCFFLIIYGGKGWTGNASRAVPPCSPFRAQSFVRLRWRARVSSHIDAS